MPTFLSTLDDSVACPLRLTLASPRTIGLGPFGDKRDLPGMGSNLAGVDLVAGSGVGHGRDQGEILTRFGDARPGRRES